MKSTENIYTSILHRAADEWNIEYEDADRDIGQQFDPMVRFMAGAVASELERVYQQLHTTEERLQERLARVLLPEYFHLPTPAQALATATVTGTSLVIEETTTLETKANEEEEETVAFSPLFPMRLLPAKLKVLAIDAGVINWQQRRKLRRRGEMAESEEVEQILIGVAAPDGIDNWQGSSLYFDLAGSKNATEKTKFLAALANSRCFLHGQHEMAIANGLPGKAMLLEDYLNGNERMLGQVKARYARHFLTFQGQEIPKIDPQLAADFLPDWFAKNGNNAEEIEKKMEGLTADLNEPLYWLEIRLSRPVELVQPTLKITGKINVFPVVNRRLHGHQQGEHLYFRKNTIQWAHLQPKHDFVAIRKVYEEKAPDYQEFIFKPFADFKEEQKPAYTLRHGGVGRWDDFNAWQRLGYIVQILQDNYAHQDLIQQAAGSLSLEDVHHLLGTKINKTAAVQKPTKDIYVLLHKGKASTMRVRLEYWTSLGEGANGIPLKTPLRCTSKDAVNFAKNSIALVTTTSDGQDAMDRTQQLAAMKTALLSRGRIVTREDVKAFCQSFLQEKLEKIVVKDGVGIDPRFDFGMTRRLEVYLAASPSAKQEDWESICHQLQLLLEEKSSSGIPIRVKMMTDMTTLI